jgi:predicted Zn-dependent peptidase
MTNQPKRNIAPPIQEIESFTILEPDFYKLSNGVEVFAFNNPNQELLKIDLIFEAGGSKVAKPIIAATVNGMLTEVTKNYTSAQLAEMTDFYGSYFDTNVTPDYGSITLYSLHRFLENTLPVLAEVIYNASFNQIELDAFIARTKQEFMVNSEKVSFIARQQFVPLLFGYQHPYGRNTSLSDFDLIDRQTLIQFHQDNYLEGKLKIFVAGPFGKLELALLETYFGQKIIRESASSIYEKWDHNPAKEKIVKIEKENTVQTALRMGFVSMHKPHEDYAGMRILSTILGGYFGSRLMNNIREDKGFTYGIGSALSSFKHETVFFIATELKTKVVQLAIEEIFKEINLLRNEPICDEELYLVKNYLQGSFQRSFDGTFDQLDRFIEIQMNGLDYGYYHRYIQEVKAITPDKIRQLAQKYLVPENIYILTVGN